MDLATGGLGQLWTEKPMRKMNDDFAGLGVLAANRHIMVGRSDQNAANWTASIVVSGNGNLRALKFGVVRRNRAGQRLARTRQFGSLSVADRAYPLDPRSHARHSLIKARRRGKAERKNHKL